MLFCNGLDLQDGLEQFMSESGPYTIMVPYVKDSKLKELLSHSSKCLQMVVRWEAEDLIRNSADLEVFKTCQDRGITLYRNSRLHLKAFIDGNKCFMGSPNISERAISASNIKSYNYELGTIIEDMDLPARVYLKRIIFESILITEDHIREIEEQINDRPELEDTENYQFSFDQKSRDPFLLSSLPMTSDLQLLSDIYFKLVMTPSAEELECAAHDLALYQIPFGLTETEFIQQLKGTFNEHPFIMALKKHIEKQLKQSLNYGGVVKWIRNNTTTVPIPRSWEIKQKQIVNILYDWICEFDDSFDWNRPSHSQIIYKRK